MTIVLDDISGADRLYPFGQGRSIAHIRIGMLTLLERWKYFFEDVALLSENPLPDQHSMTVSVLQLPSLEFVSFLKAGNQLSGQSVIQLHHAADIFKYNDWAVRQDFEMVTAREKSEPLPEGVVASGRHNIFVEPSALIGPCFINAQTGPVYISEGAEIMEGAMLRGPLFIGKNSVVKMGAKIYGGTTIGPYCMAGGEIKNSVLMGYSNKAHDGYLGDSVLGEWCNLGAGTSNSNLKNTASEVRVYAAANKGYEDAGIKCGLIMGDYSRSAINTSFNTGTVVGMSCNVFGERPGKYIPDFSWGKEKYDLEKALRDIGNWKKLKGFDFNESDKESVKLIYKKYEKANSSS